MTQIHKYCFRLYEVLPRWGASCLLTLEAEETTSSTSPAPSALNRAAKPSVLYPQSKLLAYPLDLSLRQPPKNDLGKFKTSSCPLPLPLLYLLQFHGSRSSPEAAEVLTSLHSASCPQDFLIFHIKRWPQNSSSPKIRLGEDGTKHFFPLDSTLSVQVIWVQYSVLTHTNYITIVSLCFQ